MQSNVRIKSTHFHSIKIEFESECEIQIDLKTHLDCSDAGQCTVLHICTNSNAVCIMRTNIFIST